MTKRRMGIINDAHTTAIVISISIIFLLYSIITGLSRLLFYHILFDVFDAVIVYHVYYQLC